MALMSRLPSLKGVAQLPGHESTLAVLQPPCRQRMQSPWLSKHLLPCSHRPSLPHLHTRTIRLHAEASNSQPSSTNSDNSTTRPEDTRPQLSNGSTPSSSSTDATSTASSSSSSSASSERKGWGRLLSILPPAAALKLISTAVKVLKQHFWPVVLTYMAKDCLAFLLHRFSQRLTNTVSDSLFGTAICTTANPWWLYLETSFLESNMGYQACIVVFFLLALPLNILLSSAAAATVALVAAGPGRPSTTSTSSNTASPDTNSSNSAPAAAAAATASALPATSNTAATQAPTTSTSTAASSGTSTASNSNSSQDTSSAASSPASTAAPGTAATTPGKARRGFFASLKQGISDVRSVLPTVQSQLRRVWWVDCLFNLRALPLQALSLLVLPLPWTVPRLLAVQLSVQVAVLEGKAGQAALARSSELMTSIKELMAAYGWPFVALIILVRFLDGLRNLMLAMLPVRWWQDVVEIPLALTAAFGFAKLVVIRLQDLLPLAAYLMAVQKAAGSDKEAEGPLTLPEPPTAVPTI